MRIWFIIIFLNFIIIPSLSYSANNDVPKLTKEESKEIATKVTNILNESGNEHLEKAFTHSLVTPREFQPHELNEKRKMALRSIDTVQDELNVDDGLKSELMQWAIHELAARNNYESSQRKNEARQKWLIAIAGFLTTVTGIVVPIIVDSLSNSDGCSCGK